MLVLANRTVKSFNGNILANKWDLTVNHLTEIQINAINI
jgi:hypothetical protein